MKKVNKIIRTLRNQTDSFGLDQKKVDKDPLVQFSDWMQDAIEAKISEPNAMTLASVSKEGQPDARIVLLRSVDKNGFSFFTNYKSKKGKEIIYNKKVCLNFFWSELARQVRVFVIAEKLPAKNSD